MDNTENIQPPETPPVALQRACSAGASAIDELDEWRIACNWKATNPQWDDTLKIVIAFAREGKHLAAQPNESSSATGGGAGHGKAN